MTGIQLKNALMARGIRPEEVSLNIGISIHTLLRWFRTNKPIERRTVLALRQLGYLPGEKAKKAK